MFLCLLNCEHEVFEPDSLLREVVVLTTVYGPVLRLGFRVGASGRESLFRWFTAHAVQAQEQQCEWLSKLWSLFGSLL